MYIITFQSVIVNSLLLSKYKFLVYCCPSGWSGQIRDIRLAVGWLSSSLARPSQSCLAAGSKKLNSIILFVDQWGLCSNNLSSSTNWDRTVICHSVHPVVTLNRWVSPNAAAVIPSLDSVNFAYLFSEGQTGFDQSWRNVSPGFTSTVSTSGPLWTAAAINKWKENKV